jgi:hypothetical protein
MQPHTPAALGFTTGLEAQCGVAAHVQPGAQTPASAAAAYSTPLTKVREADRMPGRADDTSGSDDDCDGSPSVRGQGPMRGRGLGRGRGRGRGRSRTERGAAGAPGGATGRPVPADAGEATAAQKSKKARSIAFAKMPPSYLGTRGDEAHNDVALKEHW